MPLVVCWCERRNVLRDGNGGWSGWIDEFGYIRHVMKNQKGSVYVRGSDTVDVTRSPNWIGRQSYYVQHGDWFIVVSAALVGVMVLLLRSKFLQSPRRGRGDPNGGLRPWLGKTKY